MTRIDANDREIEYINAHKLPRTAEPLLVAELVARGLEGFVRDNTQIPQITKQTRLPAFEYSRFAPFTWPGPR